ncbi:MAG: hypothetical protein L6R42_001832 [Xanthoria sp. 1 TBL-2021]|nr:MAG: hypothetical protein L6R42_001832 [Xanthoria sp. 1 TBL-2021]
MFLAAILARTRRSGINECVLGDVLDEAKKLGLMAADNPSVQEMLLTNTISAPHQQSGSSATPMKKGGSISAGEKVPRVLAMGVAAVALAEAGVIGLEGRRGERVGKVRLNVGEEEVKLALRDDGEVKGLGFG